MTSSEFLRYDVDIDLSNRNNSHTLMAEFAAGCARVLDVGCATGVLGAVLRKHGARVVGIEVEPAAAVIASRVLDEVVVSDVEDPAFADAFAYQEFDAVVFGDVLEHLRDPVAALTAIRRLLTPHGFVIASIPNVAHAAVRLALLTGEFRYTDIGLLDDTHLRFFTRPTIEDLFHQCGFVVSQVERTTVGTFETEIPLDPASFPAALVRAIEASPESATYQFICKAVPVEFASVDPSPDEVWGGPHTRLSGLVEECAREEERLRRGLVGTVAELSRMLSKKSDDVAPAPEIPPYVCFPNANSDPSAYRTFLSDRQERYEQARRDTIERLRAYPHLPLMSVLVPVFRPELGLLRRCVESVLSQDHPGWQLCMCDDGSGDEELTCFLEELAASDDRIRVTRLTRNGGISAATNEAARIATGEYLALLDQDDELEPGALAAVILALVEQPEADVLYTDEDKFTEDGQPAEPFFKPDWSPDQLLSHMYLGHLLVLRASLFEEVGRFRSQFDGSQDYDLALRATEKARQVVHLPLVAYHWRKTDRSTAADYTAKPAADIAARGALREAMRRRSVEATVESGIEPSTFRIRRAIAEQPLVSVIVPFHNGAELLHRCVAALRETAGYENWEALLVDNRSWDTETRAVLSRLLEEPRCRVVPYPHDFNWAALNNHAAAYARGEHLLFLNVDVDGRSQGWLEAMLEHSQRPEVGAVGARLLYPDQRVQHAGVVMGLGGGVAGHAYNYLPSDRPGYYCQDRLIRNYSAVTGACMMTSRAAFDRIGGFDTELSIAYNDIDFCLRLREAGYLVVYTPFAELVHQESAARGRASCEMRETAIMFRRWAARIRSDPYFNPNLHCRRFEFALPDEYDDREEDPWGKLQSEAETWSLRSGAGWLPDKTWKRTSD